MNDAGVKMLRNDSHTLEINGSKICFVGLGDLWAGDFDPDQAFKGVCSDQLVFTLCHNPEASKHLAAYPTEAIMSGHTHGVQTRIATQPLRIKKRPFRSGLYNVEGKKLYVNRGLGRLGRTFFNPRPEITVYTLK
jgi:hypothetical protein